MYKNVLNRDFIHDRAQSLKWFIYVKIPSIENLNMINLLNNNIEEVDSYVHVKKSVLYTLLMEE